ncbi:MAG: hypothetical protein LUD03_06295, partial [Firmicutes bacterium]|nr:hypothetical protein [Bacillota bacterium]
RPALCEKNTALLREGMYADFRCIAKREFHAENGLELNITDFEILSSPAEAPHVSSMDTEVSTEEEIREKNRFLLRGNSNYIYLFSGYLLQAFRDFMLNNEFAEMTTPVIGEKSEKLSFGFDYFGQNAELAFSPQLALAPCTAAFERVFEISHSFSAKRHGSTRHLNEFTSMNFQIGYIEDLDDVINITSRLLNHIAAYLKANHGGFLDAHKITLPKADNIPTLALCEAFEILKTKPRGDLHPTEIKTLSERIKSTQDCDFVFVRGISPSNGEFYIRRKNGGAQKFELYFKGLKIASGSENISDFSELDNAAAKHSAYFDAVKYGIMPYGGAMIGLERFAARFLDLSNIRRAAVFPRDVHNLAP